MEIPACWFFWFWSLISITFLHLGFNSLDKTDLSNSVSPVVMSLFKHSLAVSTCCSSSYALIFRLRLKLPVEWRYFWICFGIICVLAKASYGPIDDITIDGAFLCGPVLCALINLFAPLPFWPTFKTLADRYSIIITVMFFSSAMFPWYLHVFTLINFLLLVAAAPYYLRARGIISVGVHMAIESSLCLVSGEKTTFYPVIVMFVSFFVSALWAGLSGLEPFTAVSWGPDESFRELLPLAAKGKEMLSGFKETKIGKMVEFAVGMVGTVLFQSFFGLTSFDHVVAFLYLAVAWVANVALVGVRGDCGVLNFLIGNVIVGCTVSQFGLGGTTWLASGASLVLYGLRLNLESTIFVSREGRQIIQVSLW